MATEGDHIELGPLGSLVGVWEGDKGRDLAPGADRTPAESVFRERITFEPMGRVDNHEQSLFGLRYSTTAWRIDGEDPFHEELGYWLWDPEAKQVLRCFLVPRGVTVMAGGTVEPDARSFELTAERGSSTYGICSNLFLDREFRTIRYRLQITIHGDDAFSYEEETTLVLPAQAEPFRHTDRNELHRLGG